MVSSEPITRTDRQTRLILSVSETRTVADGVRELTLSDPAGKPLPLWSPGAHIDVLLRTPEAAMVRQYSLCSDPADNSRWRIAVLRQPDGRGGSVFLCDLVRAGDTLEVSAPRNNFPLLPARRYVFVAGGIGITPILPMIAAAEKAGTPWSLHYGGRDSGSMAFTEMLSAFGPRVELFPQDTCGLLDLDAIGERAASSAAIYCCGPAPLLDAMTAMTAELTDVSLHTERFTAAPSIGADDTDKPFSVRLQRSGMNLAVSGSESILDVVTGAGVGVVYSCAEGICGSCETAVLSGTVDHRDHVLSDEERDENNTMMICVSRAESSELTLDL